LNPKISVITPTYNCESVINEAINSVLIQSYSNWELLLMDGASQDRTLEVIKEYSKDSRIKWRSEPDSGIYDAMNKGVEMAKGEWIYFLGSDDELCNKNVFSEVFKQLAEGDDNVELIRCRSMINGQVTDIQSINVPDIAYDILQHQSVIYHKSLMLKHPFEKEYKITADQIQFMRIVSKGINSLACDIALARYSTEGASSKEVDILYSRDKLKLMNEIFGDQLSKNQKYRALRRMALIQIKYDSLFRGLIWLFQAELIQKEWRNVLFCLKHRIYRTIGRPLDSV